MTLRKALILMVCCSSLLLPSCVSSAKEAGHDLLTQAREDLKAAGKDIASEVGRELRYSAGDVIRQAKEEIAKSGGDIKEAVGETLKTIPDIAKGAGERAATEAIAKRIEAEEPEKAERFRDLAKSEGLSVAWKDYAGEGLAALAAIWALLNRRRRVQLEKVTHDGERFEQMKKAAEEVVESKKAA